MNMVERIVFACVWFAAFAFAACSVFFVIAWLLAKRIERVQAQIEYLIDLGADEALRYRVTHFCFHRRELKRITKYLEDKRDGRGKD